MHPAAIKEHFHRRRWDSRWRRGRGRLAQLGFELPSPDGVVVGIGVNRGRTPFTERDRTVLDLLRPHVAEAYRTARMGSAMQAALDASARAVVTLDADGQPRFVTERARVLLRAYYQQTMGGDALPDALAEWARSRIRQPRPEGDAPATPIPLIVAGEAGRLAREICSCCTRSAPRPRWRCSRRSASPLGRARCCSG